VQPLAMHLLCALFPPLVARPREREREREGERERESLGERAREGASERGEPRRERESWASS
jgi:hypothetical protein